MLTIGPQPSLEPSANFVRYRRHKPEQTVLYPIISTSYIWVAIISWYFFGESLNLWKWLGIAIIILAITVIGFGSKRTEATSYVEVP